MKSFRTFTCIAMLVFLLGSFPVAAADYWQRGDQSCSASDWFIPLRGSLERFATIFDEPFVKYSETLFTIADQLTSPERVAEKGWLKELLLNERDYFLLLHEASVGLVDASADVIENCDLSDEVSDFLSTPVHSGPPLAGHIETILSWNLEYLSPEMREIVDPCWIIPAMEANARLVVRFVLSEEEILYFANLQDQELGSAPPDLLVIYYGLALEFSEVSRMIIDDCGLPGAEIVVEERTRAAADTWQGGDHSCRMNDWFIPLQGPLVQFVMNIAEPVERYSGTHLSNVDKRESPDKGADEAWLKELLLNELDFFLVLHEASIKLVRAAAHIVEECGLSGNVSDFLSIYVSNVNPLIQDVKQLLSLNIANASPEMEEIVDPCWTVPAMEANWKFINRIGWSEGPVLDLQNLQDQELESAPPAVLVILYGTALGFLEVSREIIEDCDLTETDTGGAGVVSTEPTQESAAEEVRPTSTPVPQDPESCQWQDAYRSVLDAFLIQVNLVNADSPDAPRKLRDYALNLANSLDDIKVNCGLP